jgi:hypothetical protein
MDSVGWMWLCQLLRKALTPSVIVSTRSRRRRETAARVETLEAIELLSGAVSGLLTGYPAARSDRAEHRPIPRHVTGSNTPHVSVNSASSPVTLPSQTASIGKTLTNFASLPLSPALNLFDPSLGTLSSVVVTHAAQVESSITSQNLSPTSPAEITAGLSASFSIDGLNQPISKPTETVTSQPIPVGVFGSSNDTATFPPLQVLDSSSVTITDPAGLAFYTASPGRQSITVTMTANATSFATAPNGNLLTTTLSDASGRVTVSFSYFPPCPTVAGVGRIGLHRQLTQIVVTYSGAVDPQLAKDPAEYEVITRRGRTIPIVSATYNQSTNSVILISAIRLNVHHRFTLSVMPPCPNGQPGNAELIPFGGKRSLLGFYNHRGQFVAFHPHGSARSEARRGPSVAVHQGTGSME